MSVAALPAVDDDVFVVVAVAVALIAVPATQLAAPATNQLRFDLKRGQCCLSLWAMLMALLARMSAYVR